MIRRGPGVPGGPTKGGMSRPMEKVGNTGPSGNDGPGRSVMNQTDLDTLVNLGLSGAVTKIEGRLKDLEFRTPVRLVPWGRYPRNGTLKQQCDFIKEQLSDPEVRNRWEPTLRKVFPEPYKEDAEVSERARERERERARELAREREREREREQRERERFARSMQEFEQRQRIDQVWDTFRISMFDLLYELTQRKLASFMEEIEDRIPRSVAWQHMSSNPSSRMGEFLQYFCDSTVDRSKLLKIVLEVCRELNINVEASLYAGVQGLK